MFRGIELSEVLETPINKIFQCLTQDKEEEQERSSKEIRESSQETQKVKGGCCKS